MCVTYKIKYLEIMPQLMQHTHTTSLSILPKKWVIFYVGLQVKRRAIKDGWTDRRLGRSVG